MRKYKLAMWITGFLVVCSVGLSAGWVAYGNSHPQTPNAINVIQKTTRTTKPLVIVFWMKGCPYCNQALPETVKQAHRSTDTKTVFVEINSSGGQTLARQYNVTEVPAIVRVQAHSVRGPELVTTGNAATHTIHVRHDLIKSFYKD